MTQIHVDHMVSITEASSKGLSALVDDVAETGYKIILRRNSPAAAVLSMPEFARLQDMESRWVQEYEDARDWMLAISRSVTDNGERTSLDDVLESFGTSREELEQLPD